MNDLYRKAAKIISEADALLITAGAGMGVDSGLPDFRGPEGFWKAYPPLAKFRIRFEEMANPKWFDTNPKMAWAFYGHRLNLYRNTKPHKGYEILLKIANTKPFKYFIFTSNVDGHFQKAGFDENRIVEIHGSIHYMQCSEPCSEKIWKADNIKIYINMEKFEAETLPKCPHCGAIARPNILMFGDWKWIHYRTQEQENRLYTWLNKLENQNAKIAIIEIGAGTAVPTVRHFSENIFRTFNADLIRINPRESFAPYGAISISENALTALIEINKNLQ